jgi:hypothetical protein
MRTNGVFIPEESVTLPYLSGLIWINRINPKPKITQNKQTKDLATSPETRVVGKTFFVFFGCFLTIEAGRQMSIV